MKSPSLVVQPSVAWLHYTTSSPLAAVSDPNRMSKPNRLILRKHQQEILRQAKEIKHKRLRKVDIFTEVIPGGGKSKNVSILAEQLREGKLIKGIVWLCPRKSLQGQAITSAKEGSGSGAPGFTLGENYQRATREGFATTFASLLRNPREHLTALKKVQGAVLLVVDEVHFLRGGIQVEGWSEAFAALRKEVFDRGGYQLSMTGTARRWDENPVVNAPYDPSGSVHLDPARVISYSRTDGLADGAITKIVPHFFDGTVQWTGDDGPDFNDPEMLSEFGKSLSPAYMGRALRAFFSCVNLETVHMKVVWDSIADPKRGWLRYKSIYGNNQSIIMVDRQETAVALVNALNDQGFRDKVRKHAKHLGVSFHDDFRALLAISSDPHSSRSIQSYRKGRLDGNFHKRQIRDSAVVNPIGQHGQEVHCLVTVGQASVGMDAPACTHLINLGVTRSIPWLTQAFARTWRSGDFRWPPGKSCVPLKDRLCQIWMPADVRMRLALEAICEGTYASGLPKKQVSDLWHLLPDPADESEGLDIFADKEPVPAKVRSKSERPVYSAVPGSCGVTSIWSESKS